MPLGLHALIGHMIKTVSGSLPGTCSADRRFSNLCPVLVTDKSLMQPGESNPVIWN